MKRDDFNVRIDEVRELATKYSKPDLQRMVQMGLVEPQKAVMAGMMIDRIAKSAMQPPTTTVAQDVLGMAPTAAQGQIPQQMPPQMPQGQMPPQMAADGGIMGSLPYSNGVAALPTNLPDYAGGGIVAFADGGDIPGYAEGTLTSSRNDPAMRISPAVQAKRDESRYQILMQELKDAQRRMMRGDPGAKSDFEALQREMRSVKTPRAMSAFEQLIPTAEAGSIEEPVRDQSAPIVSKGPGSLVPPPKSSYNQAIEKKRQEILGGDTRPPIIQPERYAEQRAALGMSGIPLNPDIGKSPAMEPSAPTVMPQEPVPESPEAAPAPRTASPSPRQAEQIKVPEETTFGKEYGDIQEGYRQAGVDTEMYKKMMDELEGKKAGFAKRKEQALGAALMSFGLGLAGARQGQVFQQLSGEGQKALGMYVNDMDKITENENKIDVLKNQLRMAENNFKRTGADSALSQVRARKERIDQIEVKNAEMRERAAEHAETVQANVYHTDVWAQITRENAGAQAATRLAVAQAQAGKAGMLTQKQRFDIEQQLRTELEPKFREQYKNHPNPDKKVAEELNKAIAARIAQLQSQSSGYGGTPPAQDMFAEWSVEGM